ncbi:Na+/H+ antiporter [Paenarthrobacter sp. DKR-5]|uniref:Na+/H+ antiporter n=1 Tax=Paenarthrobacter sp. DKR-5 TaxID=2835535 RepID=UPI001BDCE3C1|nr:Na+/H+ antiporter [Paenarthrobacter sp. DKR-5]MBT1002293.1 Na+/H+ antiporter [Paenarthrobacter sp. DKR-5]
MEYLALIVGLMLVTVLAVGLGDRVRLPYPVLMVILAAAIAFLPGFPAIHIEPELILPLFLPPLLFATAQKTSWSVFRVRWRTIVLLAIALVVVTTVVVASAAWLLVPSIGIPAAVALGAMVAPPDPVAVESIAAKVHMPRRLTSVLQSEGLFNDAAAIVIFQAAAAAALAGRNIGPAVAGQFVLGAAAAVLLGLAMGWLTKNSARFITSPIARSATTLVVPFAVYIAAEELHASGVVAVVVTALEVRRNARPQAAEERITGRAFWDVVELLVTGVAFGLVGLEMRQVIHTEGATIVGLLGPAAVVCVLVVLVRALWLALLIPVNRRRAAGTPPSSVKDVTILTWCGMRGLATLALALALPVTLDDGTPFPGRSEIILMACAVLLVTLVLPGLTLPFLMRALGAAESPEVEREAELVLARRAQGAAMGALRESRLLEGLSKDTVDRVKRRLLHLHDDLAEEESMDEALRERLQQRREHVIAVQTLALDAARQEVVAARTEPGVDPESADRVLRRLDLRTLLVPELE